jgi:hypothetical protein
MHLRMGCCVSAWERCQQGPGDCYRNTRHGAQPAPTADWLPVTDAAINLASVHTIWVRHNHDSPFSAPVIHIFWSSAAADGAQPDVTLQSTAAQSFWRWFQRRLLDQPGTNGGARAG